MINYDFQLSSFKNGKVTSITLMEEIRNSEIVTSLDHIDTIGTIVSIWFKSSLSIDDKNILINLISIHEGNPLQNPQEENGIPIISLSGPKTSDGKLIVLPNLFPGGVSLYLTGAADNTDYGDGQAFMLSSDDNNDISIRWTFLDWVYLAGGAVHFMNAVLGDSVDFIAFAPASIVTPNNDLIGNCILAGPGDVLIVPANGNGTHDVDLSTAVPIPSYAIDEIPVDDIHGTKPSGFWEWDEPDLGKGKIIPSIPNSGRYNLYAVKINLARFVNRFPINGTGTIDMTLPAIKPKKILPHWFFQVTLHNSGHTGLQIAWNLTTARVRTI